MPELAIALYGQETLAFDPRSGPLVALIEARDGTDGYLVDFERRRCRVATFPGSDLDKWTTPDGLLLAARRGWWGLSIRLDLVKSPGGGKEKGESVVRRPWKRPHLPCDLASCPRCGSVVVLERERGPSRGGRFRLVTPTRRLARRAEEVMKSWGLLAFVARAEGRGGKAHRDHSLDCLTLLR